MRLQEKIAPVKAWLEKQPKSFKQGMSAFLAVVMVFGIISAARPTELVPLKLTVKLWQWSKTKLWQRQSLAR